MRSPNSFDWIEQDVVLAIHEAQITEHGGSLGVRDLGLLQSALSRPKNAAAYGQPDVPELAALYALGIIKNHPFIDGNKRVGAVLLETFLELHRYELLADDDELFQTIVAIAGGKLSEDGFKEWVRSRSSASPRRRSSRRTK